MNVPSDSLPDVGAIWHHLKSRGKQSIIVAVDCVAMQAEVLDFDALVHIQFRRARTVRVSVTLPIRIVPQLHLVYAGALQELNQTGLGCSVVMTPTGIFVFMPILLGDETLTRGRLDRAIELVLARATAALPVARGIQSKGLASA